MMKKILAAAIVSAFAAPAFAATANVDVYGKLHMSVSMFDDQQETVTYTTVHPVTGLPVANHVAGINDFQISSHASRIGFKGAEDLGGGLKAIWQIESSVNLDEQSGGWAGRNSFIGLNGGFGTALLGNHDTPLKLVGRKVDLFGDTMADSRNVMGGGSDLRAKNVVAYMTPNMAGFGIAAAYSTDLDVSGNAGDADDSGVYNLNATYENGPLFLGLGYGDGDGHEAAGFGKHYRAAAGFTFGNFKIVGQYDNLEDDNTVNAGAQNGDYDAWMAGASFTMGAMVFKGNYMTGEFDGVNGVEPEQWTVGADYNLSKRTSVYALYASGENVTLGDGGGVSDRIGGANFNSNGRITGDKDISAISVGMIHNF